MSTSNPVPADPDRALLTAYLASQRRHVLGILDGLDDEALTRPVLPSGWSCIEVVQHLALDVERFWFRCVVAGDQAAAAELDQSDAWKLAPGTAPSDVLALYRAEAEASDGVIAGTPLGKAPVWWPDFMPGRMDDLKDVVLHVIVETATHAGHLDAARELIDQRQWPVLT